MHVSHAAFIHVPGQFIVKDSSLNSGRCTQQQQGFYLLNDENSIPSAPSTDATVRKTQLARHPPPVATEESVAVYDFFGVQEDIPATQQRVFRKPNTSHHIGGEVDQAIPHVGSNESTVSCASYDSASYSHACSDDYGDFLGLVFMD
jgi:hypothetical protein